MAGQPGSVALGRVANGGGRRNKGRLFAREHDGRRPLDSGAPTAVAATSLKKSLVYTTQQAKRQIYDLDIKNPLGRGTLAKFVSSLYGHNKHINAIGGTNGAVKLEHEGPNRGDGVLFGPLDQRFLQLKLELKMISDDIFCVCNFEICSEVC
jgi:hypothetical protein